MIGPAKQWEGQVVDGKFRLLQYLGGSENADVFLTERAGQASPKAAIKLIPADSGTAELQLSRWKQAEKLVHPHLIRLFESGRCRLGGMDILYVVMEFAEENLSQILPHRALTPTEAREMLLPGLDALAYLHAKGFVHGHVKPANIFAHNDQIRLSSDAIRGMDDASRGPGKPGPYDSPESAAGRISPAGDVWSLGITLVETLTQRPPAWEAAQLADPAVPETLPAPFFEIARHCLRRDPQLRWTIVEISARLQGKSPAPPKPVAAGQPVAPAQSRSRVPAVAIVLALAVVLGGSWLLIRRHPAQEASSIASQPTAVQPKAEKNPAAPEAGKPAPKSSAEKRGSTVGAPLASSPPPKTEKKAASSGSSKGEVYDQVLPDVPQKASDTITGTVRVSVKVSVDPSGNVQEVALDSPGPSKYFANLALQAARRWSFWPPKIDSRNVASEWIVRFEFQRTGAKAIPKQVSP